MATVIPGSIPQSMQKTRTVIGSVPVKIAIEEPVAKPKATVMPTNEPIKVAVKQTVIPGTIIKQVLVDKIELNEMTIGDDPEHVEIAYNILLTCNNIDKMNVKQCSELPFNDQKRYADLIDGSLEIAESPSLLSAFQHMKRFKEIFQELSNVLLNQNNSNWFKKPKSIKYEVAQNGYEIESLSDALEVIVPELEDIVQQTLDLTNQFKDLEKRLFGQTIAIRYLLTKFKTEDVRFQMIKSNGVTIMKLIASIQNNEVMRAMTVMSYTKLLNEVKSIVFVELPTWLQTIQYTKDVEFSETVCYNLNQKLQSFIKG